MPTCTTLNEGWNALDGQRGSAGGCSIPVCMYPGLTRLDLRMSTHTKEERYEVDLQCLAYMPSLHINERVLLWGVIIVGDDLHIGVPVVCMFAPARDVPGRPSVAFVPSVRSHFGNAADL